jgi:hypothetical protein
MTRRIHTLSLLVIPLLALGIVATAANATEMVLPEFKVSSLSANKTGPSTLFSAFEIKCERDKLQLPFGASSVRSGTFTLALEGCTAIGSSCKSLGGTAGAISLSGEWHLVLDTVSSTDHRLVLFTLSSPAEAHIECEVLSDLMVLKGSFLGSIEPKSESKTEFVLKVKATKTSQELKEYENNAGEKITVELLTSTNEGTFAQSDLMLGEDILGVEVSLNN